MPMYHYTLIYQGEIIREQDQEVQDDHAAVNEALDRMDPLSQARDGDRAMWVEVKHLWPSGLTSAHTVGAYEH